MPYSLALTSKWQLLEPASKQWIEAVVPGCVHTDLLRHKLIAEPFWGRNEQDLQWIEEQDWTYRCTVEIAPALLREEHVELVAEGLDTIAELKLNGKKIGASENMFVAHRLDIAKTARPGENLLEIRFTSPMKYIRARMAANKEKVADLVEWNDPIGGSSRIRKQACSFGWDWGPRFATSGIWMPIRIEAWSEKRIESVRVVQKHAKKQDRVELAFDPVLSGKGKGTKITGTVSLDGKVVAEVKGNKATIAKPALWWPNGLGAQPLYTVALELRDAQGTVLDTWTKRIGLRTIVLDRHKDRFGESFQFVVNGRVIFAKGANWVPAHAFITECGRDLYDDLLTSAVEANMNMIRVWGGNVYEKTEFYDLCDEKGLLVWQDFMFACAQYPGDKAFLEQVRLEADHQVRRLSHHASLALWCGNNEIEQMPNEIVKTPKRKKAYEDVFYRILPDAVARRDGTTPYWPCSPHNPEGYEKGHNNERAGDCHFWEVWHERKPVKRYEEKNFRFCSEFGMQSYCSPEVAATFCDPKDFNAFGPEMENHQKNGAGNQIILDYVSRLYRFPKDYASLAYLSQLNQAYCMKVGVEHFRRSMPRTMGALYWQLNDNWPVASWSSIEFGGTWKALHYEAKRFFAPLLVSAHVPGDEIIGKCNTVTSTIGRVDLYSVYDGAKPTTGTLSWSLEHLAKGTLRKGSKAVKLACVKSVRELKLDFTKEMAQYGARFLYLRVVLQAASGEISRQTVFLTAPRNLPLPQGKIGTELKQLDPLRWELKLTSPVYQHAVLFHFRKVAYRAEDNFFDLFPGDARTVIVRTEKPVSEAVLAKALEVGSLVDTY
ncbi:beta-mannosidase [Verrucomicrobium sp. GAS474]|uniref:glycoside hydrolase family 2 protein n=1 Tax=Verrucomicrobium sp. GAS474 TaxID=1882831 RepID=UPI00087AE584|nr:glycoside hydrolase family 2 protein [Verrucomicrobium sp. GAS474]SDU20770.1 beta-mannosidase [Verrucomicrobium sp. GAS474]